jgi:hypothetical protein
VNSPSWLPRAYACSGQVTVKSFFGHRRIGYAVATVQPDCSFATQTTIRRKPGSGPRSRVVPISVQIRFLGNRYLAPASGRPQLLTLR